jgi:hypothetical protein
MSSADDTMPTVRYRTSSRRVVVVHDDPSASVPLAEALSAAFIVRFATSAGEVVEQVAPLDRLTCVVCVLGGSIRARDVHDAFLGAGGRPEQLVFVDKSELGRSALAFRRTLDVVRSLGERRV